MPPNIKTVGRILLQCAVGVRIWRRPVSIAAMVGVLGPGLHAQQPSDVHQQTTAPPNARFEVVQSELAARWTFRLDRFSGHVALLVRTKDDDNAWEDMEVLTLPFIAPPGRARFQLFTSGIAVRYTFLIDTETGKTWVVVTNKRKSMDGTEYDVSRWVPFAD